MDIKIPMKLQIVFNEPIVSSNHTEPGGNRINQILWRVATLRESWSKNSGHKDTGHKRKPNQIRASEPNGKWTLLFPGVFFIVSVNKSDYSCARSSTRNNSRYGLKKEQKKKKVKRGEAKLKRREEKKRRMLRNGLGEKIRKNEMEWHVRELTCNELFSTLGFRLVFKQTDILIRA